MSAALRARIGAADVVPGKIILSDSLRILRRHVIKIKF
jgi:hypothetical protein